MSVITPDYEVIAADGSLVHQSRIFALAETIHGDHPGSIMVITRSDEAGDVFRAVSASPATPSL